MRPLCCRVNSVLFQSRRVAGRAEEPSHACQRHKTTTLMGNTHWSQQDLHLLTWNWGHCSPFQPWAGLRGTLVFANSSRKWWCGKHPTKMIWTKHSFNPYILACVRQCIFLTGFPAVVPSPLQTLWRRWSSSPRTRWRRSTRLAWRDNTTRWVLALLLSCCTHAAWDRRPCPPLHSWFMDETAVKHSHVWGTPD